MRIPMIVVAGSLAILAASAAIADDAALKALDPDNDGTVSLAEAQAGASKVFASLNKDKDGTLDAKELGDRIDAAGPSRPQIPTTTARSTQKEYAKIVESKFKAADPDGDGTLDAKELSSPAGAALLKLIQ